MGHPWSILREGYRRNMSQGGVVTKDQWTVASLGRPSAQEHPPVAGRSGAILTGSEGSNFLVWMSNGRSFETV